MKFNWNVARAKKHLLGRMLCRMAGDQKGAVMMEYVIVAVLIAAASVMAVAIFGKAIVGMFGVATKGATGEHTAAESMRTDVKDAADTGATQAGAEHDKYHK